MSTIQQAIDNAQSGDIIRVAQGTYKENLVITGSRAIVLQGGWNNDFLSRTSNCALTVIDGSHQNSVITIESNSNYNLQIEIEGFTIRNGMANDGGGINAISSANTSSLILSLRNNLFVNNTATNNGGGFIANSYGQVNIEFQNNTVSNNTANASGGGVWLNSARGSLYAHLLLNRIVENRALTTDGGGFAAYSSDWGANTTLLLENNFIVNNTGAYCGGLWVYGWGQNNIIDATLLNNIIAYNRGITMFGGACLSTAGNAVGNFTLINNDIVFNSNEQDYAGGLMFINGGGGHEAIPINTDFAELKATLKNNIIWGNIGTSRVAGIDIYSYLASTPADITVSYSIIQAYTNYQGNYATQNCFNSDPKFEDPANYDFNLKSTSPAIDSSDPSAQYNDAQRPPGKGTIKGDLGCYGGPLNTRWN